MGAVSGRGRTARITAFGGYDWSQSENNLALQPKCRTLDSVNFLCDRGGLYRRTLENAYDAPTVPGCTVTIQSLCSFSCAGANGSLQTWLVAGVFLSGAQTRYDLFAKGPGLTGWQSILGAIVLSGAKFVAATFRYDGSSALILSNGVDDVLKWTGSGTVTRLSTYAPKGRAIAVSNGRLWLSTPDGLYVRGSVFQNADDWTLANGLLLGLPGAGAAPITALQSFQDSLLIFTTGSVYRLYGTQASDWQLSLLCRTAGCAAQNAVTEHDGRVYFGSGSALMVYDGMAVKPYLSGRLPPENILPAFANLLVHKNLLHLGNGLYVDLRTEEVGGVELSGTALPWTALAALPSGELLAVSTVGSLGSRIVDLGQMHLPAEGGALDASFRVPGTDLGSADAVKRLTCAYINGRGGRVRVTPIFDSVAGTPADCTLGEAFAVARVPLGGSGRLIGLRVENRGGDPVWINGITLCYDEEQD